MGIAIQRFVVDENGKNGLKHHIGSGTVLESTPEHLPRNIYLCPAMIYKWTAENDSIM